MQAIIEQTADARCTSPLYLAIVGAEGTGKTSLCIDLAERLAEATGLRCKVVSGVAPNWRDWCNLSRPTPSHDEQMAIAIEQEQRLDETGRHADVVLVDTTTLMTAIHCELLLGDRSLMPFALMAQKRHALTLLASPDFSWINDAGLQRDGQHPRESVDCVLRSALLESGVDWCVISGQRESRLEAALNLRTAVDSAGSAESSALARVCEVLANSPDG